MTQQFHFVPDDHVPDPGRKFYVTVLDYPEAPTRYGILSGPHETVASAAADVARCRDLAERTDPRAHWYAFGVAAIDPANVPRVLFPADQDPAL